MKIKTICDVTGLTDRTVRYYIEEQLIFPAYTENYLGRKSFEFSQEDIDTLKSISILRRFDFTIDEIRQIIVNASASTNIIAKVKQRTEEAVSVGGEKLQALSLLSKEQTYTLEQLAEELSKPKLSLPEHHETVKWNPPKLILRFLKALFTLIIVWAPMVSSLLVVIALLHYHHYPVFNYKMVALTIVSFWPSIGVLAVSKTKWKRKRIAKRILLVICAFSLLICPVLSGGIISRSETTDIRNYRRLDVDCLANRASFYQDLFPTWPHYFIIEKQPDGSLIDVYLDAHYYYCKRPAFDYTYDIYAQWPLGEDSFNEEVTRVKDLFESRAIENGREYVVLQKGNYTCLIAYTGNPPFEKVTDSYTYYIFAYDETTLVVRYIMCDSLENGADQPFYLTLDWQ